MALRDKLLKGLASLIGKKKSNVINPTATARENFLRLPSAELAKESRVVQAQSALTKARTDLEIQKFPTPDRTGALQMGRKEPLMFGSSLYDRIAQKGGGLYSADDWMNWLTNRTVRKAKFEGRDIDIASINPVKVKYDNASGYLSNKEVTIPLEELFDSNIAAFSPTGELSGGLLYAAKLSGEKIPGKLLADMVRLNPVNRIQAFEFGIPKISDRLYADANTFTASSTNSILTSMNAAQKDLYRVPIDDIRKNFNIMTTIMKDGQNPEDYYYRLTQIVKSMKQKGLGSEQTRLLNGVQGKADDLMAKYSKGSGYEAPPKYASQEGYTFPGGQDYRETVFTLPEDILTNRSLRKGNPHYSSDKYTNPLIHVRWDTRFTPDGKKVFLIHEIQSDTNQSIARKLRTLGESGYEGKNRINPFNKDAEVVFLADARAKIAKDLSSNKLSTYETEEAISRIRNIDRTLKFLGGTQGPSARKYYNRSDSPVANIIDKVQDYYPFLDRSSYASYAIKYLTNKAAKEGVDYVAVVPANYMQRGMDAQKVKGYLQFYGYPNGGKSPVGKGLAVIPDEMRKQARLFDTKSGMIKFSLSDPSKPFKSIKRQTVDVPGDKKYEIKVHKEAEKKFDDITSEGVKEMYPDNLSLYGDAYGVKVSKLMEQTQKLYKKDGGFITKQLWQ